MMNKAQILKKIGNIIQELDEQQKYLTTASKINLLELELFTANADFLIDHIEILKKLNEKPDFKELKASSNDTITNVPNVLTEPSSTEMIEEKNEEPVKKFNFSFEEPTEMIFDFEKKIAVDEVFDRELSEDERKVLNDKLQKSEPVEKVDTPVILDDEQEESVNTQIDEENGPEPFLVIKEQEQKEVPHPKEESVIAIPPIMQPEQLLQNAEVQNPVRQEEKRLTLNEMLSVKLNQNNNVSKPSSSGKKITDLKTAISINDKMVFIKELFNGYNLAYSEAIEILNRFESIDAADNFLKKNYATKNDWERKQNTVERFYEYLNKKFTL